MIENNQYNVVIIGGSYAGSSAAMALGRSLRNVLVIDNGNPCNKRAPHSHNFLTNDGVAPADIALKARHELDIYKTVKQITATVENVTQTTNGFKVTTNDAQTFTAQKVLLTTGIKDIMPNIPGFADCWGISIIHCPYCHGYEVYGQKLAVFGNGDEGFEFAKHISNWSKDVILFTNGVSALSSEQEAKLAKKHIKIIQTEIRSIDSTGGQVNSVILKDGSKQNIQAIFARTPFEQQSDILQQLGCALTEQGHIAVDSHYLTTIPGVYAAGDNSSPLRALANVVAAGTMAGVSINKALIEEEF